MAGAYKPAGSLRFWLNGLPCEDLSLSVDAGSQKYWFSGLPTGLLWTGLRPYPEQRTFYPSGPQQNTKSRYWIDGLPFDALNSPVTEGAQNYWLNGLPTVGLFPAANPIYPFPAHFLAP